MKVWITLDSVTEELEDQILEEVDFGSDRATAIVLAAFVEDHLTRFIRSGLAKDERLQQKIFGPGGALGDFGMKINIGYLFNCYTPEAWKELDTIRRIRNDFAHNLTTHSFEVSSIKDRCTNLTLWKKYEFTAEKGHEADEPERLSLAVEIPPASDAKAQFVNACRFFIGMLTIYTQRRSQVRSPLF